MWSLTNRQSVAQPIRINAWFVIVHYWVYTNQCDTDVYNVLHVKFISRTFNRISHSFALRTR